jgi:hypothetical protein
MCLRRAMKRAVQTPMRMGALVFVWSQGPSWRCRDRANRKMVSRRVPFTTSCRHRLRSRLRSADCLYGIIGIRLGSSGDHGARPVRMIVAARASGWPASAALVLVAVIARRIDQCFSKTHLQFRKQQRPH